MTLFIWYCLLNNEYACVSRQKHHIEKNQIVRNTNNITLVAKLKQYRELVHAHTRNIEI